MDAKWVIKEQEEAITWKVLRFKGFYIVKMITLVADEVEGTKVYQQANSTIEQQFLALNTTVEYSRGEKMALITN